MLLTQSPGIKECVILCGGADAPDLARIQSITALYSSVKFIGVDRGGLKLIEAGHTLDHALGDFDSVNSQELATIKQHSHHLQSYSPMKDDTDMELALELTSNYYPEADYYIFGGIGEQAGRLDHLFANVWLIFQPRYQAIIHRLQFIEYNHVIKFYTAGKHQIEANERTDYLSIISMTAVRQLSIKHAKYNLEPVDIAFPRALISNEFINQNTVQLSFIEGIVMVMWVTEG